MSEQEPFGSLVELGSAMGELGAALSHAQWRIDQAALDLAVEMTQALAPAFRRPEDSDAEASAGRAAVFVRERLTFYSMPRVDVRLAATVRATRTRGGLIRMLLGSPAGSSSEETAGEIQVSLVAVPAGDGLEELIRGRGAAQQEALLQYLLDRGVLEPGAPEALRRYGLEAAGRAAPAADWGCPAWQANLRMFQRVWNHERREEARETADLLPETGCPDRVTLAVLGELAEHAARPEDAETLRAEARLLLAALSPEDDVHNPDRGYSRTEWTDRWARLHARAVGSADALQPTRESVAALRRAWGGSSTVR